MRIRDLRKEPVTGGARVVAEVAWEDVARPPVSLFFRTEAPYDSDLHPHAAAFLTAAAWPAFHAGEQRIHVEGPVCPRLRDGLLTVLEVQRRWGRASGPLPVVEAARGFLPPTPVTARRTALFLSGGVDSLASLRANRAAYPPGHAHAVQDVFLAHGLDIGGPGQAPRAGFFERVRSSLAPLVAEVGVLLIPVWTNVRALDPDGRAWGDAWFGPGTVALAHAFASRISDVLLAASLDVEGLAPSGSHPLIDPYLSSAALEVHHDGLLPSRLEKIRAVVAWAAARSALRVCWQDGPEDGPFNCGRCRKCVRAMLGLIALGALADVPTFPRHDLTPTDLVVCTVDAQTRRFYEELLAPLEGAGRGDLAAVLRRHLAAHRADLRWPAWRRLRRLGHRLVGR